MRILALAEGRPRPDAAWRWQGQRVIPVVCDGCGKDYLDYAKRVAKAKKHYCSAACQRSRRDGEDNPNWKGGPNRICQGCEKPFRAAPSALARGQGKFCSRTCKVRAQTIHPTVQSRWRRGRRKRELRLRTGREMGVHSEAEWRALLARHQGRCAHCGTTERIERDHIIPLAKGGTDAIENIQPLCRTCNARKWMH